MEIRPFFYWHEGRSGTGDVSVGVTARFQKRAMSALRVEKQDTQYGEPRTQSAGEKLLRVAYGVELPAFAGWCLTPTAGSAPAAERKSRHFFVSITWAAEETLIAEKSVVEAFTRGW